MSAANITPDDSIALTLPIALGFVAGVCIPMFLAQLPPSGMVLLAVLLLFLVSLRWPRIRIGVGLLVGFAWASFSAQRALDIRVDGSFAGEDISVSGMVVGLPRTDLTPPRFELIPDDDTRARGVLRGRARLSWYGDVPPLQPGQQFSGRVRLRSPRGVENPGGFDFARYALAQRLAATGYVRQGEVSEPVRIPWLSRVDRLRADLSSRIQQNITDRQMSALLRALAVGDQRDLSDPQWDTLRSTGTGHLIAISGMHIGLVAAFGALLFSLLYRIRPKLALYLPKLSFAALGALVWATAYALLAGWSLPVQRTLVMIVVVLLARVLRRHASMPQSLALAAVAVLVWDPLAVMSAGFWLSFVGVAGLMWALPDAGQSQSLLRSFGRAQIAMSLGLLPITIAWFGQGSLIGPLANVLAVPWITFVVVPCLLLAILATGISVWLGQGLLHLAAGLLKPLWWVLTQMASMPGASWYFAAPSALALILATLGAIWLFLPRGAPLRAIGLLLFLPLLWPRSDFIDAGDARLSMLDVGQGMSVLVQTQNHAMLYDAGPRSHGGFDFGEAVVVPSLRALGVRNLDRLMLSNQDADHAGGRDAVLRAYPQVDVSIGIEADAAQRCESGQSWVWDGVTFEVLHPPLFFPDKGNESSCVLRIQSLHGSALLTGDIGEVIETRLLRERPAALRANLVFVPHHGSRNSSSANFVAATGAQLAFNSSGAGNSFGHPHPITKARWLDSGAQWVDTQDSGFARVSLNQLDQVDERRRTQRRYWQ